MMSDKDAREEATKVEQVRTKSVVKSAMQWDGSVESAHRIVRWVWYGDPDHEAIDPRPLRRDDPRNNAGFGMAGLWLKTLESGEGRHIVSPKDYVIRGLQGEFYPCKPDIYAKSYEPVAAESQRTPPKIYRFPEAPESCPECDGTSFITAGGDNLICRICFLSDKNDELEERIKQLESQRTQAPSTDYPAILERERTQVAEGVTAIRKALDARHWLTEGRGSYEWDDDRWHSEFAAACTEILTALEPLKKIARDFNGCPTSQAEVEAARAGTQAQAAQPESKND